MKQESKIKRIFQAFTEESDLSSEIVNKRREICKSCPFNTLNIKDEDLTLLQRQKKVMGNFCTKCGCFIDKKTERASEACGLEDVGLEPKWNRILLKTTSSEDLDIRNLSPDKCNIKISDLKENYEIEIFSIDENFKNPIEIEILSDVDIISFNPYCGCVSIETVSKNKFKISLDTSVFVKEQNIIKTLELKYNKNDKNYETLIILKGKKI